MGWRFLLLLRFHSRRTIPDIVTWVTCYWCTAYEFLEGVLVVKHRYYGNNYYGNYYQERDSGCLSSAHLRITVSLFRNLRSVQIGYVSTSLSSVNV